MDAERQMNPEGVTLKLGLHTNTTFSIAYSKKIKMILILNFLLCVTCMIISCSVAFYCWDEMTSIRRQVNAIQTDREARMDDQPRKGKSSHSTRKYNIENLGSDMLLIDLSKKDERADKVTAHDWPAVPPSGMLVSHFSGAIREINLGKQGIIAPWSRDGVISSRSSEGKIESSGTTSTPTG